MTDGKGICTPNNFAYRGSLSDDDSEIPLAFTSISKLYEHFDELWKNKPEEVTDTYFTSYSVYFTKKDSITYPSGLYQTIGPRGKDVCGYGGEFFALQDYYDNYKIPYNFEYRNFAENRSRGRRFCLQKSRSFCKEME